MTGEREYQESMVPIAEYDRLHAEHNRLHAALTAAATRLAAVEAEREQLRECDCVHVAMSSFSCQKCGRPATITAEHFTRMLKEFNAARAERDEARGALLLAADVLNVLGQWFIDAQPDVPKALEDQLLELHDVMYARLAPLARSTETEPDHAYEPVQTIEGVCCRYCKGREDSPRHFARSTETEQT